MAVPHQELAHLLTYPQSYDAHGRKPFRHQQNVERLLPIG